jgi:hypothetical protein
LNEHKAGVWYRTEPVQYAVNIPAIDREAIGESHAGMNAPVLQTMLPANAEREEIRGDEMQWFEAALPESLGSPES